MKRKAIHSFTLKLNTTAPQRVIVGDGGDSIVLVQADRKDNALDVWSEVHSDTLIENGVETNFVVLPIMMAIPDGYIHVGSAMAETGDSYHLYREATIPGKSPAWVSAETGLTVDLNYDYKIGYGRNMDVVAEGRCAASGVMAFLLTYSETKPEEVRDTLERLNQLGTLETIQHRTPEGIFSLRFERRGD